jgi:hypothetical protein
VTTLPDAAACIHACQEGCGRPYDAIFIQVVDGSTLFYCIPCLHSFLVSLTRAMVEGDDPQVREVVAGADLSDVAVVTADAGSHESTFTYTDGITEDFFVDGDDGE